MRPFEVDHAEVRPFEVGLPEVRPFEVGPPEVRPFEVGLFELRPLQPDVFGGIGLAPVVPLRHVLGFGAATEHGELVFIAAGDGNVAVATLGTAHGLPLCDGR